MLTPEQRAHPKSFIASLQGLRFLAAAMVLLGHLLFETRHGGAGGVADPTRIPWVAGVDLFFIISGFIMYYLGVNRFGQPGYVRQFIENRVIRVVPLYWGCTTLLLAVMLGAGSVLNHSSIDWGLVATSYLMLPPITFDGTFFPLFGLGWTLNYEIFFYGLFAIALCFPRRTGLLILFGTMITLAVIGMATRTNLPLAVFYTRPIILEFLFGIVLAMICLRGVKLPGWARIVLILGGFAGFSAVGHLGVPEFYYRSFWAGPWAFMIAAGALLGDDLKPGRLTDFLVEGGGASYSLYLTHMFSLRVITIAWHKAHLEVGPVFVLVAFAFAMVAAYACYRLIEIPMLEFLRQRLRRK